LILMMNPSSADALLGFLCCVFGSCSSFGAVMKSVLFLEICYEKNGPQTCN
jgi:hypothetical protein